VPCRAVSRVRVSCVLFDVVEADAHGRVAVVERVELLGAVVRAQQDLGRRLDLGQVAQHRELCSPQS
jgi:hypothetical protein